MSVGENTLCADKKREKRVFVMKSACESVE